MASAVKFGWLDATVVMVLLRCDLATRVDQSMVMVVVMMALLAVGMIMTAAACTAALLIDMLAIIMCVLVHLLTGVRLLRPS